MRVFIAIVALAVLVAAAPADAAERYKLTNDRRQVLGDIYDPGHGRRLQIRDNHRRIIGYIERDGTVTDTRRRKVRNIENFESLLEEK